MRLIDADALKKDIEENVIELGGVRVVHSEVAKALIDNTPTVAAISNEKGCELYGKGYCKGYIQGYEKGKNTRPQGEWIAKRLWDNTHIWICSECGNQNTHGITVEKACWKCGADMRKGGKDK